MRKLLVANRGEIARRIAGTAQAMGISVVAVHTEAERGAPHVVEADEAVLLDGSGPAAYLDVAAIVAAARRAGADAVHPGYGFLAENATFARAVVDAGLVWVGPSADAIATMGDKIEAKRVAAEAGVPTLDVDPGDPTFPVLVKAAMGGGGKGMRIVRSAAELEDAMAAARRESSRAFGDDTVFLEPYVERARHVEIQVLGDAHGNLVHLFERECSIQRRHQKVVEEAPSPAVDDDLRERMGSSALALARAIGYRNAGTIEFLLADDGSFAFLEMNTRLQVEHPVTEAVTGVDLVEQQLLVASGEPMSVTQDALRIHGHAIEVRLNAEDPANDFLPTGGVVVGWAESWDPGVRYDAGVDRGTRVDTSFDPLIAKVIAHGPTRARAAAALASALEGTTIQGIRTNRDMLVSLLRDPAFLDGDTTTDFLERVEVPRRRRLSDAEREAVLAAIVVEAERRARVSTGTLVTLPSGWRNSVMPPQRRLLEIDGDVVTVAYRRDRAAGLVVDVGSGERSVVATDVYGARRLVEVAGHARPLEVTVDGGRWWVHGPWGDVEVVERSPFPSSEVDEVEGSLTAPMPGSVVSVEVAVGDTVSKGKTLVVLEAMKMEHPIASPEDGVVAEVNVAAGDQVERGTVLVVLRPADA